MMTMTKLPAFSRVVDGDVGLGVEKDLINPNGLTHMVQVVFAEVAQGECVSDAACGLLTSQNLAVRFG
jgi:hypothetical protein